RRRVRVRIRVDGRRIEVPDAADDPPPSAPAAVEAVVPGPGPPAADVVLVEAMDVAVPPSAAAPEALVRVTAAAVVMLRARDGDRAGDEGDRENDDPHPRAVAQVRPARDPRRVSKCRTPS